MDTPDAVFSYDFGKCRKTGDLSGGGRKKLQKIFEKLAKYPLIF